MQIDFTIEKYICSVIKDNSNFYVMSKFKFLCALFMVVAMNVNVNAQSYLTNSYKGYVDAGYSIGIGDYEFGRVEINTSHGYQFNPYFFLGAGVGLHFMPSYETSGMDIPLDVRDSKVDIPVFANIRSHFSKGKFAPFADLKGGTYITNGGGLYVVASVGIRYALNDKQGLSLSLGYTNENLEFEVFDGFIGYDSMDYTRDKKQYNTEAVAIKLGFDF